MSDNQGTPPESGSTPDPIKNLKAETDRKINNMAQENARLSQQLSQLAAQMAPKPAERPSAQEESDEQLMYSNPSAYAARIQQRTEASILGKIQADNANQNKKNGVLIGLANEYPELNDTESPLMLKATELWAAMPADERSSPLAYKLAVKEAASELNIKTRKQRPEPYDEPSINGNRGGAGRSTRKPTKLPAEVEEFAYRVGALKGDENDAAVKARILENMSRTYNKWERPKGVK